MVLVISTVGLAIDQLQWVMPGAVLSLVWLLAGQIAQGIQDRDARAQADARTDY
ncbi:hypothetical protein [Gemmatimonas sp.]|uniref:hypothetical protein n=1 Tax=Gemmatimonas sp. TaxID=1962908 RepID=UPI003DA33108